MRFHYDAGHGWLAVPLATYPDALTFGTGFGYVDRAKGIAYLEEDVEAPAFLAAHPELAFADVPEINDGNDSPIRMLPRIPEAVHTS